MATQYDGTVPSPTSPPASPGRARPTVPTDGGAGASPPGPAPAETESPMGEEPRCYMCGKRDGEGPACERSTRIVRPCCCEGPERFVHQGCLQKKRREGSPWSPTFWECEMCGASYRMHYRRHWLRLLTSMPALATVCFLNALVSIRMSSEVFRLSMPTLLPWLGETDETVGSEINLNIFGLELGYWAGGLLMLTFLHKLLDRNWMGVLQFLPLFQMSIRSTNDATLAGSGLTMGIWYFLCLYSCYAASRFIKDSCHIIQGILSACVGDEVLDFVSASCLDSTRSDYSSSSSSSHKDDDLCICCMDLPIAYKMSSCGHLICCKPCRPRLVYHSLKNRPSSSTLLPMRMMTKDQLDRTPIRCPVCRTESILVGKGSISNIEVKDFQVGSSSSTPRTRRKDEEPSQTMNAGR